MSAGAPALDTGRRRLVLHRGRAVVRLDLRTVVVTVVVATVVVGLALLGLAWGDYPLTVSEVVGVLTGATGGFAPTVVLDFRLPRVLAAIVFGAALGVSGGVFQTLTRNPLASPDVVGLANGAFTGMLVALLLGAGWPLLTAGSLVGGLLAAALIYVLAWRGGLQTFRFVVVGVGVSAALAAVNSWLLLRAELETALFAAAWGAGTLNGVAGGRVYPAAACLVLLLALVPLCAAPLRQLELGDDTARATGVAVGRVRLLAVGVAVALVSVVTAVAGPVAFVALAAPQVARRLCDSTGIGLLPTAGVGALLLLGSDLVAQHALPVTLPVGVVTVVVGGAYLAWLLAVETRRPT